MPRIDSGAEFFGVERFGGFDRYSGQRLNQRRIAVTFVSKLCVVTAYLAFAFVGAIVLGVI